MLFDNGAHSPFADVAKEKRTLVSSVDAFQGQEKEVILLSLVRSNVTGALGFVRDWHRANVSLTRAKRGLVVFGNPRTLVADPKTWRHFLRWIITNGLLPLEYDPQFPQLPPYDQNETRSHCQCLRTTKYKFASTVPRDRDASAPAEGGTWHEERGPGDTTPFATVPPTIDTSNTSVSQPTYDGLLLETPTSQMLMGGGVSSFYGTRPSSTPSPHPLPPHQPTQNLSAYMHTYPQLYFPIPSNFVSAMRAHPQNIALMQPHHATVSPSLGSDVEAHSRTDFSSALLIPLRMAATSSEGNAPGPRKRARDGVPTDESDQHRHRLR